MTAPSTAEITNALVAHIREASGREIGPNTRLVDEQVFDSMGLIVLVSWVEERFSVSFDAAELEQVFQSVSALADSVGSKVEA